MFYFSNSKSIKKEYEEYVLTRGDFNECIFLGEDADEEIGTPGKLENVTLDAGSITDKMQAKRNRLLQELNQVRDLLTDWSIMWFHHLI